MLMGLRELRECSEDELGEFSQSFIGQGKGLDFGNLGIRQPSELNH